MQTKKKSKNAQIIRESKVKVVLFRISAITELSIKMLPK